MGRPLVSGGKLDDGRRGCKGLVASGGGVQIWTVWESVWNQGVGFEKLTRWKGLVGTGEEGARPDLRGGPSRRRQGQQGTEGRDIGRGGVVGFEQGEEVLSNGSGVGMSIA